MFEDWKKKLSAGWKQITKAADTVHNHLEYETKRKTERSNTFNQQAANATNQLVQNTVSTAQRAYDHRSNTLAIRQAEVTGDRSKLTEKQKDLSRPIGSKAYRNGKPVYWSGDSYSWQSPESHQKLKDQGHFRAGDIGYKRVQKDIGDGVASLLSPEAKAKLGETLQTASQAYEQHAPQEVKDFVSGAGEVFNQVNEATSRTLNISPTITGEALTELATLGAGKAVSYGGRAGLKVLKNADIPSRAFELQRDLRRRGAVPLGTAGSVGAAGAPKKAQQALAIADTPDHIPRRPGNTPRDAQNPEKYMTQDQYDTQMPLYINQLRNQRDEAQVAIQNIVDNNPGISKKQLAADKTTGYKAAAKKYKDLQARVSSAESSIVAPTPDRQYAYPPDRPMAKKVKAEAEASNLQLGRALGQLELHHLIPKGASAAVYNRVRKFIDLGQATGKDLHRIEQKFKKAIGHSTGDLKENLLAMSETPHNRFHTEMRKQPSWTFKGENLEMTKEALSNRLMKIKNMKDFEAVLDQFIENDIKPLVENARIWEPTDDILKSLGGGYTGRATPKSPEERAKWLRDLSTKE